MTDLVNKLALIAGTGKLSERDWRTRCALGWHDKPKSVVRHLIYGERCVSLNEAQQIEAAHVKAIAKKVEANRAENEQLFNTMRQALAAMEAGDAEFYREQIEAMGAALDLMGHAAGRNGRED